MMQSWEFWVTMLFVISIDHEQTDNAISPILHEELSYK